MSCSVDMLRANRPAESNAFLQQLFQTSGLNILNPDIGFLPVRHFFQDQTDNPKLRGKYGHILHR
jgi:hypothetical protein